MINVVTREEVRDLIARYGTNTNSFLALYKGFQYFSSKNPTLKGVIAFFDTSGGWAAVGEPLADPEVHLVLLREFAEEAKAHRKTVIFLPVTRELAEKAKEIGFGSIMIGTEPSFDLDRYPKSGQTWIGVVATSKQLYSKGARVKEFRPENLEPGRRAELDEVVEGWLGSRKMDELSFLNQVEPWLLSEDKKYFWIEYEGKILAFVAAVPVWPKKGWYLLDVMRRPNSDAGTTELLILESMRLLKDQGAKEATLGVAPIAGLENAPKDSNQRVYRFLKYCYDEGTVAYQFKPLYQFKAKFQHTHSIDAFMMYYPARLGVKGIVSLIRAFVPGGVTGALFSGTWRTISRFDFAQWIRARVHNSIVVRSAPHSFKRLIFRCRITTILFVLNIAIFLATMDSSFKLRADLPLDWGFSAIRLGTLSGLYSVFTSPFLHWNVWHLLGNLAQLVLFAGCLEFLVGSNMVALCFLAGALLANPITAVVLVYPFQIGVGEIDVGASLGVFGCAGALCSILRNGKSIAAALIAIVLLFAGVTQSLLSLDHLVALGIGAVVMRFYFRK